MFILVVRIVLVVMLLFGMVVVLLGIRELFNHDIAGRQADADRLRKEVYGAEDDEVISSSSVFHNFLTRSVRRRNMRREASGVHK